MAHNRINSLPATWGATVENKRFVKINASGKFIHCAAATDRADGVSNEGGALDAVGSVLGGFSIVEVESGAAVALGDKVTSDADGKAIPVTAATHIVNGTALSVSAADGQIIKVLLGAGTQSHRDA